MISLILLVFTGLLSAIAARIGAIALELTGLPEEQADFQSISAFSGVGYTTKEAEYALSHPERRKIIKRLIQLGSVGVITTIATLGVTLASSKSLFYGITSAPRLRGLPFNESQLLLILLTVCFYGLYKAMRRPALTRLLKEIISAALLKGRIIRPVSFHEILVNGAGYGIFQVEVSSKSPLLGQRLRGAELADRDVEILYVNRLSESINHPSLDFEFQEGDILSVFGPAPAVRDMCLEALPAGAVEKKQPTDEPLSVGSKAPGFRLPGQSGGAVGLEDFLGRRNLVMVFYPRDKSFFCSSQLKDLSGALDLIEKLGGAVVAVNQESEISHAGFCDAAGLKFPLLSDPAKEVCRAYKTLMLGGLLVDRTVYIVDQSGVVRYAKRGKPPLTEILGILRGLKEGARAPIP